MLVSILILLIILLGWGLYRDLIIEYYNYFIRGELNGYGKELWVTARDAGEYILKFLLTLLYFPITWLLLLPSVVAQDLFNRYRK